MAERRSSLRGRLLALLVAGTGIVWATVAIATFFDAREHAGRLFDAQLTELSEVLGGLVAHEAYHFSDEVTSHDHNQPQGCTYQVFSARGELLLRSEDAPTTPLATGAGFADVAVEGARWRALRRYEARDGLVIIVAHRLDERDQLIQGIALRLVLPMGLGLPLIAAAIWLAVSRALKPVDRLAAEVGGREAGRLGPVEAAHAPREIEPLVSALNDLFARLQRSFESERRFTGDAAHELRTPLAALKTHAEVALTTASDERRRRSLEQVVAGVDRATRLVEQLLAMARVDSAQPGFTAVVDLARVAAEALGDMRGMARNAAVTLSLQAPPGRAPAVRGEPAMLHALVRNLVENAIRHTPPGGEVRVRLERHDAAWVLAVEDSGAGVPEAMLQRIFDRHFRGPGEEGGAAGLGLSIARRIAELHGGRIAALRSGGLGGLEVRATLPASDKETLSMEMETGSVASPTTTQEPFHERT